MNISLVSLLVLGIIITALADKTTASRNTRQAGRCSAGQECILLTACPELLKLLNPPTQAGIKRLQELTCAFDRRNPKVCCDASSLGTPRPPVVEPPILGVTLNSCSGSGKSNLLPQQCGSIGERVIGGIELPVRSYMWMALLGYGQRNNPDWRCGGSLISQRYVVTAAHCIDRLFSSTLVKVRLGEHDINKDRDCQMSNIGEECAPPVQDFNPEQTIMHPSWNKRTNFSDDIALIRLDRPAQFHGYVQPICLPPPCIDVSAFLRNEEGSLREAEVAGWGWTEQNRNSDVKLMVKLPFVPLDKCKPVNKLPLLEKGQLCFGGVVGKDSCSGDSGGPLVSADLNADSTNLYVLLGVVSYGPTRCGRNLPAVYTDVAQYRNWIVKNLQA